MTRSGNKSMILECKYSLLAILTLTESISVGKHFIFGTRKRIKYRGCHHLIQMRKYQCLLKSYEVIYFIFFETRLTNCSFQNCFVMIMWWTTVNPRRRIPTKTMIVTRTVKTAAALVPVRRRRILYETNAN